MILRFAEKPGIRSAVVAWLPAVCAFAFVVWFYHWTVKTSGGFFPPGDEDYYNLLVRGWRAGQLSLSKEPAPEMLLLADPYDPVQNGPHRLVDASYFQGRYYLYFGAVPAAVAMVPYQWLTGKELATTTAIFAFAVVGFSGASILWLSIRRRFFPASAVWMAPVGILALGLATHVPALLRRPRVWELPIASAYAFSMLGLCALHWLVVRPSKLAAASAGLCFGLAIGSRPTYIFASLAILPVGWLVWRRARKPAGLFGMLVAGLVLCVAASLAHNYARFGSALEFGQNYQLSSIYESKAAHFRPSYLPHNFATYYFQHPEISTQFPYLAATPGRNGPPGYLNQFAEPVCGLAVTMPWLWLALAATWAGRGRDESEKMELRSLVLGIAAAFAGMSAVALAFFLSTPRYMADFAPTLALLAGVGALAIERAVATSCWRPMVKFALVAMSLLTCVTGFLISVDYHDRLLKSVAPHKWEALERLFRRISG